MLSTVKENGIYGQMFIMSLSWMILTANATDAINTTNVKVITKFPLMVDLVDPFSRRIEVKGCWMSKGPPHIVQRRFEEICNRIFIIK